MKKLMDVKSHDGRLTGFLLYQSDETVLLDEINDFRRQGFILLSKMPKRLVTPVKNGLYLEGVRLLGLTPRKSPFSTKAKLRLQDVFEFLKKKKIVVRIDDRHKGDIDHFFGIITGVTDSHVEGRFLATDGYLRDPEIIAFKNIKLVEWNDSYLRMMTRLWKLRQKNLRKRKSAK